MAAKETVNSYQVAVESIVNRWLVDYYLSLALDFFKSDQYLEFCEIRDVIERIVNRPLSATDITPTKILVLQLLSRINEGERLDSYFDSDRSITPLESALMLLEKTREKCNVPQQDMDKACTSVKEMLVSILIKNKLFDKAKAVLLKHFPKPMVGKKAIFMGIIRQRKSTHDILNKTNFQQFKEEMLAFCQSFCKFTVPFLHKAATQFIDKLNEQEDEGDAGEQDDQDLLSAPQTPNAQFVTWKHSIIQRSRLEAAYKALTTGSNQGTFAQLEGEVQNKKTVETGGANLSLHSSSTLNRITSRESEKDGLFQRDTCSPMEASPVDQQAETAAVAQTHTGSLSKVASKRQVKKLYTVAELVVEPDSQVGSQCTTSQELEAEVRPEEPAPSLAVSSKKALQRPEMDNVTILTQQCSRQATNMCSRASTSPADVTTDSEGEPRSAEPNRERCVMKNKNKTPPRRNTIPLYPSSDSMEDTPESPVTRTPVRKRQRRPTSDSHSKDTSFTDEVIIEDSSLDSSPSLFPHRCGPRISSTPHKGPVQDPGPSHSKWKQLYNNAKESKDTWSDEEPSDRKSSGSLNRSLTLGLRKKWSDIETQKLKEGVEKFGEGNWHQIKSYYHFRGRTNVNLKDRWRTMKKTNIV